MTRFVWVSSKQPHPGAASLECPSNGPSLQSKSPSPHLFLDLHLTARVIAYSEFSSIAIDYDPGPFVPFQPTGGNSNLDIQLSVIYVPSYFFPL